MALADLIVGRKYPIETAKTVRTRFGETILIGLRIEGNELVKVYLPRRYCGAFTAEALEAINTGAIILQLIYEGMCEQSGMRMHRLAIV